MSALVRITTGIMPQHSRVGMSRAMAQFGEAPERFSFLLAMVSVEYNARYHNYSLLMKAFQTTAFQFPERMQHIIYTRYTHIAKEPKADVFPPELEGLLKGTINSRICFLYTNRTPENNDQSEVIMSKFCMTFALPIAFPRQVVHCHKPPYSGIPGGNGGFAGLAGSWIFRDCQRCNCNG